MKESILYFISEAQALGWVQWISFISGLLYIYYASKNNPSCWPWGILSSGLWAYASCFQLHLLSDSILQIAYVLLGFWGWHSWYNKKKTHVVTVSSSKLKSSILYLSISTLISIFLGMMMQKTNAAFPMIDAFLSVFSITATLLLIQQKIENWGLWIAINLISIPLFILRGGHLFAVLFFLYFLLSIQGWIKWRKLLKS